MNFPKRKIDGILLLDKPTGLSSSFVLKKIKDWFCAEKAGHTGTLDQLATGMLPICFGKATKITKYLLNADKRYRVFAKLGESTNTFDANGMVVKVSKIQCSERKIKRCLESFKGRLYQIPPMFSSIKYYGIPLYKYARKGIDIPRKPRMINVYNLCYIDKIMDVIELEIQCSKGTYIRSIVHDIGEKLECGAHVVNLRRLMVGKYTSKCMIDMNMIQDIFYNNSLNDLEVLSKLDKLLISMKTVKRDFIGIHG